MRKKPICEKLIETIGKKESICISQDIVYGLGFEYQQLENKINKTIKYIKENKRLQQNNYDMQREMAMCWQKIDKAVEYIKNESYLEEGYMIPVVEKNPLLNILQNGSDEE